jgi:gluconolactonase
VKGGSSKWWSALAVTMAASACGGATRKEVPSRIDASGDFEGGVDGGDVPDLEPDIEPGDAGTVSDAEIPKLDFGDIGKPALVSNRFQFTEGPVWDPAQQVLFFTDIDGDTLYRFTPPDAFDAVLTHSGRANGLAIDAQGRLLVAGFGARNVWRFAGAEAETLADDYQGSKLNSPDDLVARSDGTIYFTDPTYGIDGTNGPAGTAELGFMGVFRLAPGGDLHLEDATSNSPNGASLSPDEHTLYVSFTSTSEVAAFDVATEGSLANKRTFASGLSIPDGMTIDRGGNLYVAVLRGVAVIAPTGALLGTIALAQWPSNCAFGGPDQKTLFITARNLAGAKAGALYRIDDMPIAGVAGQP